MDPKLTRQMREFRAEATSNAEPRLYPTRRRKPQRPAPRFGQDYRQYAESKCEADHRSASKKESLAINLKLRIGLAKL